MIFDSATLSVISSIFSNLAAAWFAATLIAPAAQGVKNVSPYSLAMNIGFGIMCVH